MLASSSECAYAFSTLLNTGVQRMNRGDLLVIPILLVLCNCDPERDQTELIAFNGVLRDLSPTTTRMRDSGVRDLEEMNGDLVDQPEGSETTAQTSTPISGPEEMSSPSDRLGSSEWMETTPDESMPDRGVNLQLDLGMGEGVTAGSLSEPTLDDPPEPTPDDSSEPTPDDPLEPSPDMMVEPDQGNSGDDVGMSNAQEVRCGERVCDLSYETCCVREFGARCEEGSGLACTLGGVSQICDGPEDCGGDNCCLSVGIPGDFQCTPRPCINLTLCHVNDECPERQICRSCQFTGVSLAVCALPNVIPNLALSCDTAGP